MQEQGLTAGAAGVGGPRARAAKARGLTLVELMTTLAVLVITLTLAAPSLGSFLRGNRLKAVQSELVSSLMFARSEAARRGTRVSIKANASAGEGGFARGWQVWVDANANGAVDSDETVVRAVPGQGTPLITTSGDVLNIVFNPSGFLAAGNSVTFCLFSRPGVTTGTRVLLEPVGWRRVASRPAEKFLPTCSCPIIFI